MQLRRKPRQFVEVNAEDMQALIPAVAPAIYCPAVSAAGDMISISLISCLVKGTQLPSIYLISPSLSSSLVFPEFSVVGLPDLLRQWPESCCAQDPDWYMNNQISGGPGYLTKKRVSDDISMYTWGGLMGGSRWGQAVAG